MGELYNQHAYATGLTLIYGPAGVGKTTFLMQLARNFLAHKKKILILDTERGFTIKRLQQIMGDTQDWHDYLFLIPLHTFQEQEDKIKWLIDQEHNFDFIGIDTLGAHYRKEITKEKAAQLQMQCRLLKHIARKKPVILTNQVYSTLEENTVKPIGGQHIIDIADHVVELRKDPRIFLKLKPEKYIEYFEIKDEGLVF